MLYGPKIIIKSHLSDTNLLSFSIHAMLPSTSNRTIWTTLVSVWHYIITSPPTATRCIELVVTKYITQLYTNYNVAKELDTNFPMPI